MYRLLFLMIMASTSSFEYVRSYLFKGTGGGSGELGGVDKMGSVWFIISLKELAFLMDLAGLVFGVAGILGILGGLVRTILAVGIGT